MSGLYDPKKPFHIYCRSCDVEGHVKAGVTNGFDLESELRVAFEQQQACTVPGSDFDR